MDAQYYLIGTDGRHYGPLSNEDVHTWLADGRASRHSRARRDTQDQWLALREMPEFEEATRPPHLGGAPASPPLDQIDAGATEHDEAAPHSGRRLDPVACFRQAWRLVARDFALLAGWTLIVAMAIIAISLIPRVGWLVSLLVNNLLMSGLYVLFLARMRSVSPALTDIVALVRASAVQIVLAGLAQVTITAIALGLLTLPGAYRVVGYVFLLPGIYLAVGYAFVLPLVIDRQMPVWSAMELSRTTVHRNWFQTFGLLLAAGMLLFISASALGVGLVLTLPLCTAALMFAYEHLFG